MDQLLIVLLTQSISHSMNFSTCEDIYETTVKWLLLALVNRKKKKIPKNFF